MSRNKKKKSIISVITSALVLSFVITLLLVPLARLIYPLSYEEDIARYAQKYNIDKYLVMGIISSESNFRPDAVSHKSAIGLMQLTEDTANWCIDNLDIPEGGNSIIDPDVNIAIGCAYIRYLIDNYDGNVRTAVAAYNAGPGNVDKWLSDIRYSETGRELTKIPFPETENYVKKVEKRTLIYAELYKEKGLENTAQK